jgi:hypothetical protein
LKAQSVVFQLKTPKEMIRKVLLIIGLTVVIVLVVIAFSLLLILQGTCVTEPRAVSFE